MKRLLKLSFAILLASFCSVLNVQAEERDSVRFSLLTCSPGTEVYELYGHTAIRYQNIKSGLDIVLNYGIFDFNTPNFLYRFVRGETDYQLGITFFSYFKREYESRGSSVVQQTLNLTPDEAFKLDSILRENYLPENRVYRYNYFYDNCTTRARDRIEDAVNGRIFYPVEDVKMSFRDWIHRCTAEYPWAELGADLCLGSEADIPIDTRLQMFIPANLESAFRVAYIKGDSGVVRKLVSEEKEIISASPRVAEEEFPLSPMQVALILVTFILLWSFVEWRCGRIFWGLDIVLFALQGVAGCIVAFLFFFSVHPTVGSNYLLIIFNPIPLFYLPIMICNIRKRRKDWYDILNIVVLTLFISFLVVIPQKISLVVVPLALSLLIRSVIHLVVVNKSVYKRWEKF